MAQRLLVVYAEGMSRLLCLFMAIALGLASAAASAEPAKKHDWNGDPRYFGRPGFYGGRYNGGGFGPCWTRTPIGPVWNCG